MDAQLKVKENRIELDKVQFHKMVFLCNALDGGWSIKKRDKKYIFTKNHENKKEVFEEAYLGDFVHENSDFSKILGHPSSS